MSDDDVARILKHPMVSVASDAGVNAGGDQTAHPRAFGNTARVLGEYVRERKILTLEEAVRKMTSLPAAFFKFEGRGVIREGAAADLVLFDPATVKDAATRRRVSDRHPARPGRTVSSSFVTAGRPAPSRERFC